MKPEELCDILGEVNESYISRARPSSKRKKLIWISCATAAACLILAIGVISSFFAPRDPVAEAPSPAPSVVPTQAIPWNDLEIFKQYYFLFWNDSEYGAYYVQLSPEMVGTSLGLIDVHGFEHLNSGERIEHTKPASIYEIKGISPDCSVAVQFEDTEEYYTYVHQMYRPETLGQFIADLNLTENLTFGSISYSGAESSFRFDGADPDVIWELLLSERNAIECFEDFELHLRPKIVMGISINYTMFGINSVNLSICEGGHISFNLLGVGKMFYIGEANTEAFMDYVWENCSVQETPYHSGNYSNLAPVPSGQHSGASSPSQQPQS